MKNTKSVIRFCKKPFLLGNLSFLIRFRYTFQVFPKFLPRIPRNATISALNACTTLIVRATRKNPAVDSGPNPCSCLDESFVKSSKIAFHLAGEFPCENEETSTFLESHWNISHETLPFLL